MVKIRFLMTDDVIIMAGKLPPFDPAAVHEESGLAGVTLLAFPTDQDESELDSLGTDALLGNDFVFFAAFVAAFVFNWIGFLLLMCFCHTIAARYVQDRHHF